MSFNTAYEWTSAYEGGFVEHPKDPGGRTMRGVTQRTYDAFRRRRDLPPQDVKLIDDAEHLAIFHEQYWLAAGCDRMRDAGLAAAVFDFAINSGPARAVRTLQEVLGVAADGIVGEITLEAIGRRDAIELIVTYCQARLAFVRSLRTWPTFGRGWERRIMGEMTGAQDEDTGIVDRAVRLQRGTMLPPPVRPAPGKADASDEKATEGLKEGSGRTTVLGMLLAALTAAQEAFGLLPEPLMRYAPAVFAAVFAWALYERLVERRSGAV